MKTFARTQLANLKKLRQAQSGTARAALLGISDGLITNISLTLGVAGAGASSGLIRVAGIASLIAGALSMAVGEYISMRGQIELLSSVLTQERAQLRSDPVVAHHILEKVLLADGVTKETAHKASLEVARDPEKAMAMYARGNLGIDPDQLGSAWGAAGSSLVMFSAGAFIPLVPWFFGSGNNAVVASLSLSAAAALAIGAYLGYTTSRHVLRSALRQLILLVVAAAATYAIGRLFHTNIA